MAILKKINNKQIISHRAKPGGWIFNKGTIYEKVLAPLYPSDYDGVGFKEKSIRIQNDTWKRINDGLGELIKAHGNQKT